MHNVMLVVALQQFTQDIQIMTSMTCKRTTYGLHDMLMSHPLPSPPPVYGRVTLRKQVIGVVGEHTWERLRLILCLGVMLALSAAARAAPNGPLPGSMLPMRIRAVSSVLPLLAGVCV